MNLEQKLNNNDYFLIRGGLLPIIPSIADWHLEDGGDFYTLHEYRKNIDLFKKLNLIKRIKDFNYENFNNKYEKEEIVNKFYKNFKMDQDIFIVDNKYLVVYVQSISIGRDIYEGCKIYELKKSNKRDFEFFDIFNFYEDTQYIGIKNKFKYLLKNNLMSKEEIIEYFN